MEESASHEGPGKDYRIVVNGVQNTIESDVVSFDQVVALAYPAPDPNNIYSVTFEKAKEPREGELLQGHTVAVKNGTEFDVELTGKS